jgi:hypothetical protein
MKNFVYIGILAWSSASGTAVPRALEKRWAVSC